MPQPSFEPAAPIRLQKYIALSGLASRREAEKWIVGGLVQVNGLKVCILGTKILPNKDQVLANGQIIKVKTEATRVYALHKPPNCVCTHKEPENRKTIIEFFPQHEPRLVMVGRLDYDANGLIILTTNGQLALKISHPTGHVKKVYHVKVQGRVENSTLHSLRNFKKLEGKILQKVQAEVISFLPNKTWLKIILEEGKNQQIKKMLDILGHRVIKIQRTQIGGVHLKDLPPGAWRRLTEPEIKSLQTSNTTTR